MKKTFKSFAAFLLMGATAFSANAQDFKVPDPSFTVPIYGEAELLYNFFQITWGYYELTDNAGDDPITCTLTMPDGSVKTLKGSIDDANMEGTLEGKAPTTENNALSFRNFMQLDQETMQYIQQYGTYKVNIPEGMVLVNGVENPEVNMQFTIKGTKEIKYMNEAQMVYPTSSYLSYASAIQLYWKDQEIYFVEDVESLPLVADIDGKPVDCLASIQQVEGGNEDGTGYFSMDVLYIVFNDFISYTDGTYLTVSLPEGIIANAQDEVNQSQSIELTLLPQLTATFAPESNSTLKSEDAFVTISWEGLSLQPLMGTSIIAREVQTRTDYNVNITFGDKATITLDLTSLPNGEYEIIMPEAFLLILTEKGVISDSYAINSDLFANYSIIDSESSGIEGISQEAGVYKVYTIDGQLVLSTPNFKEVQNLPSGLYIINGKKTLIRK